MKEIKLEQISPSFGGLQNLHNSLPTHLQEIMQPFAEDGYVNDYEVVLFSLLCGIGATNYKVKFNHGKDAYHLNFYVFLFGMPASGKGIANLPTHYFKALSTYKKEEKKRTVNGVEIIPMTVISGDTTNSALTDNIATSSGLYLNETEADQVIQFRGSEANGLDATLRKAYSNDTLTKNRKGDGITDIENTILGCFIAGTPDQAKRLIDSTENGLFSRIAFIQIDYKSEFTNPFTGSHGIDYRKNFQLLGKPYAKLWQDLYELEDVFLDFSEVGAMITAKANEFYQRPEIEDKQIAVRQLSINTARIAGVLTVCRNIERSNFNWQVSIEDAETAMKITEVLYNNSQLSRQILGLKMPEPVDTGERLYKALPQRFKTFEAYVYAEGIVRPSMVDKYLRQWCEDGLLKKEAIGRYLKTLSIKSN